MIAVEAPVDRLTAPAQNLVGVFLLIGLIVIGAGTVIGWRMTSGIATSMVQLTEAAEAIAHNRADAAIPVDRADEVGRLGRAFAVMRDAVKTSRDTLESQVLSRTQELRVAQSELVKRERLATLGQLSSSVGHELRNPLGVMTNAVYFLEMTLTDVPKKAKDYLGIIRSQVRISEKIVSDLLDFARVKPPQRARVAVTQLVDDQLGRVTVPDTVRIDRDGIDSAGSVWVDQVQIGQVILNVVTNALQAMEEKGGVLAVTSKVEAGMVRLEVTDSGPGITPENMERIFEPLFTTKARGIGLGLSVSRSLAESNGGQLTVTSAAGKGATFSLTMPTGEG